MEKGEIVWIPCRISQGMFEYERQIRLEGMSISGFVNVAALENPDVEVGRVRGLVFEEDRESEKVRVFVPGEFVQSSNVMVVPHRVLSSLSST